MPRVITKTSHHTERSMWDVVRTQRVRSIDRPAFICPTCCRLLSWQRLPTLRSCQWCGENLDWEEEG